MAAVPFERTIRKRLKTFHLAKGAGSRLLRRDIEIKEFLTELAVVLLQAGVTPKHFGELAKHAFVEAAGRISKLRNGKINRSRAEVKRLLSGKLSPTTQAPTRQSRADRVIGGWMSNPRFLGPHGRPQRLPIVGARVSFASLVKQFGGDVPHRAVLEELRRLRVVRQIGARLELDARKQLPNGRATASLSSLIPVLIDAIRLAGKQ